MIEKTVFPLSLRIHTVPVRVPGEVAIPRDGSMCAKRATTAVLQAPLPVRKAELLRARKNLFLKAFESESYPLLRLSTGLFLKALYKQGCLQDGFGSLFKGLV